jgi:hypothetical protein
MVAHAALSLVRASQEDQRAVKPLTTQFVKRAPRLTKPLELKKRPRPRRRQIHREMVSVKARAERGQRNAEFAPTRVLSGLARPDVEIGRGAGFAGVEAEPLTVASRIEGAKETEKRIDMGLELVDVDALNTGRYYAMVIQDPTDKRNIKGFFRLKYAYSPQMRERQYHRGEDRILSGLAALVGALNKYTAIKSTFEGRISYDSRELLLTPWVLTYVFRPFEPGEDESAQLGAYLTGGGFLFVEAPDASVASYTGTGMKRPAICLLAAHHMIGKALATQGRAQGKDWVAERLPHAHPLFHCYFDFDGPPPSPWDEEFALSGEIEGVQLEGRLVLLVSQKCVVHLWDDPYYPELRNERMIQFGVNTIVFALTQEGSITRRLMESVR